VPGIRVLSCSYISVACLVFTVPLLVLVRMPFVWDRSRWRRCGFVDL